MPKAFSGRDPSMQQTPPRNLFFTGVQFFFRLPLKGRVAIAFVASALVSASLAHADDTATLTIKIERVSKNRGNIRIALYDGANWGGTSGKPAAGAVVPAIPGETVVTLNNLKPGIYAIKTFQDENKKREDGFRLVRNSHRTLRLLQRRKAALRPTELRRGKIRSPLRRERNGDHPALAVLKPSADWFPSNGLVMLDCLRLQNFIGHP